MTSGDMLAEEPGQAELQDPTFLMYSYKVGFWPKRGSGGGESGVEMGVV